MNNTYDADTREQTPARHDTPSEPTQLVARWSADAQPTAVWSVDARPT